MTIDLTRLFQSPLALGIAMSALIAVIAIGVAVIAISRGDRTANPAARAAMSMLRAAAQRLGLGRKRDFDPDRADADAVFRNIAIWGDDSQPVDKRHRALAEARNRLNRLADTILASHAANAEAETQQDADSVSAPRQTEILLVDDEATLRDLTALSLREMGFIVHRADNAEEALAIVHARAGQIDLVLSDVVMPGASGPELAGEIAKSHPDIPVIFMSGYEQRRLAKERMIPPAILCLSKPFTLEELLAAIRDVLAARRHHSLKPCASNPS